jgi:hypothetical protein
LAAQSSSNQKNLLAKIPFKVYYGGVIVIEARIDTISQPLNFIFDTGSSGISLDSSTCKEFNLTTTPTDTLVTGIAGTRKVSYLFNKNLTVGNLVTDSLNFFVNDYTILNSVYGDKIDGIIGYSFLSKYVFDINFDSLHIKIYKPGNYKYPNGGTFVNTFFSRLMRTPLVVKDKEKSEDLFYIDSGAGLCLLLTEDYVKDKNFLLPRRKPVISYVQGLGGKKGLRLTVVKRLQIGPYAFRNVPTNLYSDDDKITFNKNTVGLIGNDILRRFNMVLNYGKQEFFIKPNNNYTDPFDYAYTGLTLYKFGEKVIVDDIVPGSPAAKAGLINGDEVLSVGLNFSGDVQTYEKLLQKTYESTKIFISRNSKVFFVSITPTSIL